jgi:hypothetical protein
MAFPEDLWNPDGSAAGTQGPPPAPPTDPRVQALLQQIGTPSLMPVPNKPNMGQLIAAALTTALAGRVGARGHAPLPQSNPMIDSLMQLQKRRLEAQQYNVGATGEARKNSARAGLTFFEYQLKQQGEDEAAKMRQREIDARQALAETNRQTDESKKNFRNLQDTLAANLTDAEMNSMPIHAAINLAQQRKDAKQLEIYQGKQDIKQSGKTFNVSGYTNEPMLTGNFTRIRDAYLIRGGAKTIKQRTMEWQTGTDGVARQVWKDENVADLSSVDAPTLSKANDAALNSIGPEGRSQITTNQPGLLDTSMAGGGSVQAKVPTQADLDYYKSHPTPQNAAAFTARFGVPPPG